MAKLLLISIFFTIFTQYIISANDQLPSENAVIVECVTTKGNVDIVIEPDWSPIGVQRFLTLVDDGFFKHIPLFRCVNNFLCQFGYNTKNFEEHVKQYPNIKDDKKIIKGFKRGYVSFAGNGQNSRSFHLFVTLGENVESLGRELHETPIGYISKNTLDSVVSKWYTGYGDMHPWGPGPSPDIIVQKGYNSGQRYLNTRFPKLDYIESCSRKTKPDL